MWGGRGVQCVSLIFSLSISLSLYFSFYSTSYIVAYLSVYPHLPHPVLKGRFNLSIFFSPPQSLLLSLFIDFFYCVYHLSISSTPSFQGELYDWFVEVESVLFFNLFLDLSLSLSLSLYFCQCLSIHLYFSATL